MILQLVRRDPAWKFTPWITAAAVIVALFCSLKHANSFFAGMAAPLYLVAFMRALPHQRATFFEAALPVSGRDLLLSRFFSLMLMVWLPAAAGSLVLGLSGYQTAIAEAIGITAIVLTLGVIILLSVRIQQFAAPAWLMVGFPTVATLIMALAFTTGYAIPLGALCAAAAIALGARTWKSVPEAFQCAPMEVSRERKTAGSAAPALPWWPIIRSLFPWQMALFIPVSILWTATGDWIFGTMYMMIGYSQARMTTRWALALPFSRKALFALSAVPMILLLAGGTEVGMLTGVAKQGKELIRQGDPDHFRATGTLDVVVNRAFWKLAPGGRVPVTQAPWGESYQPEPLQALGLTFYDPYAVGPKNSQRFEDWQFARATTEIYGRPITARQLAEGKQGRLTPVTLSQRMQILSVAAVGIISLLWLWLVELFSWHRLGRLSKAARTIAYSGASSVFLGVMGLDIVVGQRAGFLSQPAMLAGLLYCSHHLPENPAILTAIALAPVLVLFWIASWQADAAEISPKVEQNQSIFARFGGRP